MPGIIPGTTLNRRRVVQLGAGAMVAAMTGVGVASARQGAAGEYTFVVAGLDYREGFDEHNNDVLMVSRLNTELGTVRTVSIPRDLYVEIPGYGLNKITKAFHSGYYGSGETWEGGAQVLADTIATNFGLTIDGVATTTFVGFREIIEAVGGLEVVNPYQVEGFGEYPSFPEGPQTLNGEAALTFVRTRTQDGDGGRNMRQQLVLVALLEELQKPEVVTELPELIDSVRDAVETNIPMELQAQFIAMLPTFDPANVEFTMIDDLLVGGIIDNGMWVYQADWSTLPGVVQGFLAGS